MESGSGLGRLVRALGLLAYGVSGWQYLASGLVVPIPAVGVLWVIWSVGLAIAIRQSKAWPWAAPIAAVAAVLFWVLFVLIGSQIFGWVP